MIISEMLPDQEFPHPTGEATGQQHQQRAVGRCAARALDAPLQDNELLPEERILEDECGPRAHQIGQRPDEERGGSRFHGGEERPAAGLRDVAAGGGETLEELGEHGGCSEYDVAGGSGAVRLPSQSTIAACNRRCLHGCTNRPGQPFPCPCLLIW